MSAVHSRHISKQGTLRDILQYILQNAAVRQENLRISETANRSEASGDSLHGFPYERAVSREGVSFWCLMLMHWPNPIWRRLFIGAERQ